VREVALAVAGWMLVTAGIEPEIEPARAACEDALRSGAAAEKLAQMVRAQGGDPSALDRTLLGHQPAAVGRWGEELSGTVTRMDALGIGRAALAAGAGRRRKGDNVDPAAGLRIISVEGERTDAGDPVIEVLAGSEEKLQTALGELHEAVEISDRAAPARPPVIDVIPPEGRA
jgi:thymidine phosphorylase